MLLLLYSIVLVFFPYLYIFHKFYRQSMSWLSSILKKMVKNLYFTLLYLSPPPPVNFNWLNLNFYLANLTNLFFHKQRLLYPLVNIYMGRGEESRPLIIPGILPYFAYWGHMHICIICIVYALLILYFSGLHFYIWVICKLWVRGEGGLLYNTKLLKA